MKKCLISILDDIFYLVFTLSWKFEKYLTTCVSLYTKIEVAEASPKQESLLSTMFQCGEA